MGTVGVVRWFDRESGVGVVWLDDGGGDCVVRLAGPAPADGGRGPGGGPRPDAPGRPAWRDLWPDLAHAERAGTWGEGGRDY